MKTFQKEQEFYNTQIKNNSGRGLAWRQATSTLLSDRFTVCLSRKIYAWRFAARIQSVDRFSSFKVWSWRLWRSLSTKLVQGHLPCIAETEITPQNDDFLAGKSQVFPAQRIVFFAEIWKGIPKQECRWSTGRWRSTFLSSIIQFRLEMAKSQSPRFWIYECHLTSKISDRSKTVRRMILRWLSATAPWKSAPPSRSDDLLLFSSNLNFPAHLGEVPTLEIFTIAQAEQRIVERNDWRSAKSIWTGFCVDGSCKWTSRAPVRSFPSWAGLRKNRRTFALLLLGSQALVTCTGEQKRVGSNPEEGSTLFQFSVFHEASFQSSGEGLEKRSLDFKKTAGTASLTAPPTRVPSDEVG